MPIDPSVILAGRPADTASGLNDLAATQNQQALQQYNQQRQQFMDANTIKQQGIENKRNEINDASNLKTQEAQRRLLAEHTLKAHYDTLDAHEKFNLTSTIAGAAGVQPFLTAGDLPGATNFLQKRQSEIKARGGDTSETDYAIAALQSGDPAKIQELQHNVAGLLAAGQVYGIIKPQKEEGFTLQPGQTRYDQNGKPVVTAPINSGMTLNAPNGSAQSGEPVKGEDFLKTLDPNIAAQVKALAEGRQQFPAGFALKSPYWQSMISAVSQYDPSFDAVNYNARSKTRGDFTSGKSAQNITALNTAIAHLATLKDSYDKLANGNYPSINAVSNWMGNEVGNTKTQTNTTNVDAAATAVSHELAKVFRSTGMSESDIKDWQKKITTSATPAQSDAVISSAIDLMNGRLEALGQQYNQGMGTTKDPIELLSPEAKKSYQRLSAKVSSNSQPTSGNLPTISSPNDPAFVKLPSGAQFIGPDGIPRIKH